MKYIRTKDGIRAYNEYCDLSYIYQMIGGIKVADTIEEYNRWVPIRSHYSYRPFELTQEEYDLLEEVLKWKH